MEDFLIDGASEVIHFMVFGKPRPKERPRSVIDRKSGRVIHYTPKKTTDYQAQVAEICAINMRNRKLGILDGGVGLYLSFVFKAPKSAAKGISDGGLHIIRPDIDNVAKAILDGLNGVLFHDDKQICDLRVSKRYGIAEFVKIVVYNMTK